MSFLAVCLNPTLQKTLNFSSIVPDAVNRTGNHRLDASGKGVNVTRVLTQLGKRVVHLTQLGGNMRPMFLSLCEQDGLSVEWVESQSQIRFCYTLLTENDRASCSGATRAVTELVEESQPVGPETEGLLFDKYDTLLALAAELPPGLKCLIISGTKAAGFSDSVIPSLVRKAKEKGLYIILDIKGKDLIDSLQYEPDIVKPNLYEFAGTFVPDLVKGNDLMIENNADKELIKSAMLNTAQKYRCRIVLTDGSRNILAADRETFFETEILPIKTVNSIGSGDAFTAGLAAALSEGADFIAAISEGVRCGALNASLLKPGVIY